MTVLRTIDAIRRALDIELRRDPSVIVLGEDVSYGGPFGATKGLAETYGRRIRDTPISEATVVGMTVGAALSGLRPVVEVMYIDFITLAMDQLVNHAAKLRYMTDGLLQVPMVVRAQGGARGSMGAHHSQSLEAWFTHVPGLTVVAPATPADAQGLLQSAIRSDDPVLYLEHRGLYWTKADVPDGDDAALVPIGSAVVRRAGSDVTIVSWSHMVTTALDAAAGLPRRASRPRSSTCAASSRSTLPPSSSRWRERAGWSSPRRPSSRVAWAPRSRHASARLPGPNSEHPSRGSARRSCRHPSARTWSAPSCPTRLPS